MVVQAADRHARPPRDGRGSSYGAIDGCRLKGQRSTPVVLNRQQIIIHHSGEHVPGSSFRGLLSKEGFEATMVFPQDIPLIQPDDVQTLYQMRTSERCVLVVPSRKFDGTNALFRTPPNVMETHYDEDSYKIHLNTAEKRNARSALVLIRRIMLDIDDQSDLKFILSFSDTEIANNLRKILD